MIRVMWVKRRCIFLSTTIFWLQVLLAMRANVEDRGMKGDCTPLMEVRFLFSQIPGPPTISVPDCLILVCCLVVFTAHATSNMLSNAHSNMPNRLPSAFLVKFSCIFSMMAPINKYWSRWIFNWLYRRPLRVTQTLFDFWLHTELMSMHSPGRHQFLLLLKGLTIWSWS